LKFASGAVGGVHLNYVQRPPAHRLEIVGTKGTLRWDGIDGLLYSFKSPAPFGSFSDNPPAPVVETFAPPEGFERNQLFLAQTRHFLASASGESEPRCTLADGVRTLSLALAAKESARTGRVISMSEAGR
jgi:predicted dehydrogenase